MPGRALFGIVAVFAQLRVDLIRENTRRGLEYARQNGRIGGRPTVMTTERIDAARTKPKYSRSRDLCTTEGTCSSLRNARAGRRRPRSTLHDRLLTECSSSTGSP
ncbi:recombinase family protein [Microbacterium sp. BWT-B31]|uniref:recombinase family protein n=1 Tax=Microbacterium sp. BWT-B31 TaxID=3232072 RepID=UPI003529CE78